MLKMREEPCDDRQCDTRACTKHQLAFYSIEWKRIDDSDTTIAVCMDFTRKFGPLTESFPQNDFWKPDRDALLLRRRGDNLSIGKVIALPARLFLRRL